jgi:hypothetical protein
MHSIRLERRNRKDTFDLSPNLAWGILSEVMEDFWRLGVCPD